MRRAASADVGKATSDVPTVTAVRVVSDTRSYGSTGDEFEVVVSSDSAQG